MSISNIPPLIGFLMISLLPNEPQYKWTKWGAIFMTIPFAVATFLGWSIIPSNVGGRTKRTAITAFTFLGYCAGNMTGSQIFEAKDAVSCILPPIPILGGMMCHIRSSITNDLSYSPDISRRLLHAQDAWDSRSS